MDDLVPQMREIGRRETKVPGDPASLLAVAADSIELLQELGAQHRERAVRFEYALREILTLAKGLADHYEIMMVARHALKEGVQDG
jgi:hypothetical protein